MRKLIRSLIGGINSFLSWYALPTQAGVTVSEDNVMGLPAYWAAVNQISDGLMNMPIVVRKIEKDGERAHTGNPEHRLMASTWAMRMLRAGAMDMEAENHPVNALFSKGVWPYLDATDFIRMVVYHLLTHGSSYWRIESGGRGEVTGLQPLLPNLTRPYVNRATGEITYQVSTVEKGSVKTLPYEEVLHFKGLTRDGVYGLSPMSTMREPLGLAIAAERYGARFFANNATPSTAIQVEGVVTDDQMDLILDRWDAEQGGENQGGTAVLGKGMKIQQLGMPPNQSQFLGTRIHGIQDSARIHGLPPSKLYDLSNGTYSNVAQEDIAFRNDTLRPIATRICAALDAQLLMNDPNHFCAFEMVNAQWADQLSRYRSYQVGIAAGFLSPIEARRAEGLPDEMPEDPNKEEVPPQLQGESEDDGQAKDADGDGVLNESSAEPEAMKRAEGDTLITYENIVALKDTIDKNYDKTAAAEVFLRRLAEAHRKDGLDVEVFRLDSSPHEWELSMLDQKDRVSTFTNGNHAEEVAVLSVMATRAEANLNPAQTELAGKMDDALEHVVGEYGERFEEFFEQVGREIYDGYEGNISQWVTLAVESEQDLATLNSEIHTVFNELNLNGPTRDVEMREIFEALNTQVLDDVTGAVNSSLGVSVNLPDHRARQVIADGGKRVGLVDLDKQSRDAVFKALHEARSDGLGVDAAARKLREHIEAGPFPNKGVNYRAKLIARTEAKHAQRVSALELYDEAGWTVIALDGLLGDASDEDCKARNGKEYTIEEAKVEMNSSITHPNCTLTFIPKVSE